MASHIELTPAEASLIIAQDERFARMGTCPEKLNAQVQAISTRLGIGGQELLDAAQIARQSHHKQSKYR
jgi:hypothetical protein